VLSWDILAFSARQLSSDCRDAAQPYQRRNAPAPLVLPLPCSVLLPSGRQAASRCAAMIVAIVNNGANVLVPVILPACVPCH
jgi:hypothetical protein